MRRRLASRAPWTGPDGSTSGDPVGEGQPGRRVRRARRVWRAAVLGVLIPVGLLLTGAAVLAAGGALAGLVGGGSGDEPGVGGRARAGSSADPDGSSAYAPAHKRVLDRCPASLPAARRSGAPDRLPPLTLACLGRGPDVRMDAGRTVPTVVNLWASWCDPCREEMPRLRKSSDRLGARAVFLGVDTKDNPDDAWAFLADAGVRYPQVVDPDGKLLAGLRLPGIPVTYVVDPSGRIVYRKIGEMHPRDITELEAAVSEAG